MDTADLKQTALYARLSRLIPDQTSTERQLADEKKFSDLYGLPPAPGSVPVCHGCLGKRNSRP